MARLKDRGSEAGLREFLLEGAVAFRDMYGLASTGCWEALSQPVNLLVGREPFSFSRFELPPNHPLRRHGALHDRLTLTEGDELL
ncbi:hypothetical protein MPNTM1_04558 [Mycolicibacterium parafortuitum]|uniref:hypothetical protein n=1 Tax=Mycolicibacterium parafortuitum TaxID=39692 RepID=UPI0032C46D34